MCPWNIFFYLAIIPPLCQWWAHGYCSGSLKCFCLLSRLLGEGFWKLLDLNFEYYFFFIKKKLHNLPDTIFGLTIIFGLLLWHRLILVILIFLLQQLQLLPRLLLRLSNYQMNSHETGLCLLGLVPECKDSQWAHPGSWAASSPGCPTPDTCSGPRLLSPLWKPAPGARLRHGFHSRVPAHPCV